MFLSNKCDQRLKAAFELYNQQLSDNLPNKDELKTITFSQTFETKMKKLLAAQKKSYYYMINTVGKRIAIIITALLITLTATTFGVKAIRETVIEFITETFEKFTRISITNNEDIPAVIVFQKIQPQYIPDGFEMSRLSDYGDSCLILYSNSQNNIISYSQQINYDSNLTTDTEGAEIETVYINSLEGIMYTNKDFNKIIFGNEKYYFILYGQVSKEELYKIAESIPVE